MKRLDDCQEYLYDLEEYLDGYKDHEVVEFLSDHWKECLVGSIAVYFAMTNAKSFIQVKMSKCHVFNQMIQVTSTALVIILQKRRNQVKIDAKRVKFEEKKRSLKKILSDNSLGEMMTLERETILALDILELIERLKDGQLEPLAVLEAYQVSTVRLI